MNLRALLGGGAAEENGTLLGQSLLRLEVNTILKTGMTGEAMPPLPMALHELMDEYVGAIGRLAPGDAAAAAPAIARAPPSTPNYVAFENIKKGAEEALVASTARAARAAAGGAAAAAVAPGAGAAPQGSAAAPGGIELSEADITLIRIARGSAAIASIIQRLPQDGLLWTHLDKTRAELSAAELRLGPYPEISPTALLRIRKLWELGTEQIVAQTSISLGGDVVMRVSPTLLEPKHAALLAIHRDAVATSTGYWRDLVTAAATMVGGATRALLGRR